MNNLARRARQPLQAALRRSASSAGSRPASGNARRVVELSVVGATALFAGAYITWQTTSNKRRVLLDAQRQSAPPAAPLGEAEAGPSSAQTTKVEEPAEPSEETEQEGEGSARGGAYNPETGEINWDCPCLGGMAHGPCGEQFREAFSCFIYSEEEPKGINCVDKFKIMQDCFREHPDVYAEEIADDEEHEEREHVTEPSEASKKDMPQSQSESTPEEAKASS